MSPDEYREPVEQARDSLYALLRETEPGTGLLLHRAYRSLKDQHEEEAAEGTRPRHDEQREQWAEYKGRSAVWLKMPRPEREHLVLEAIGDDRLTLGELVARINEHSGVHVHEQRLRPLVYRLHREGKLDRTRERRASSGNKPGAFRYRFFRWRELSGPIADLERTFNGEEA